MLDVEKFIAGLHDYIGRALAPLARRVRDLEQRQPLKGETGERGEKGEKGDQGPAGAPGRDADEEAIAKQVDARVARALEALLPQIVQRAADLVPRPADGKEGPAGAPGADGRSITVEDVRPLIQEEQQRSADAACARWALEWERLAADRLQRAIEAMPKPKDGRDGRDGLSVDDMHVEHDGDGCLNFRFLRDGEVKREFTIRLPRLRDRGPFAEGKGYVKGDAVSFGGSLFIAQKDEPLGKPGESTDWRLAVKRGRDGRDAKADEKAPAGPVRLA